MPRQRVTVAVCLWLLLFPVKALAQARSTAQLGKARAAREDDIREAVLRYQMLAWISGSEKAKREFNDPSLDFDAFFVSLNRKDPTPNFLKRFRDISSRVRKASLSRTSRELGVYDSQTHKKGIVFNADAIRWFGDDLVEVDGGYCCGGRCGAHDTFTVQYRNGHWAVVRAKRTSVL